MTTCMKCNKIFTRGKYYPDYGWYCEDCLGYRVKGKAEWVPNRIKVARKKYAKDMVQPYRSGELSKEFTKVNPEQTKKMVNSGAITKEQVKKAKNVWTDVKEVKGLGL